MKLNKKTIDSIVGEKLHQLDYPKDTVGYELQLLNNGYAQAQEEIASRLAELVIGVDEEKVWDIVYHTVQRTKDDIQYSNDITKALSTANILKIKEVK